MNMGISKDFVKDVANSMDNNSSALFIITRDGNSDMVMATLRPYKGEVLQTSLDDEAADALRDELSKRIE